MMLELAAMAAFMVWAIVHVAERADWWQDEQDAEANIAAWRAVS